MGALTYSLLFNILHTILDIVGPTLVVIDGLDECFSSDPRRSHTQEDMLKFVTDICALKLPTLHLFVTLRPEPSILRSLEQVHPTTLQLSERDEHREDMANYVDVYLVKLQEPWNTEMREKARTELNNMQKSQGM